MSTKESLAIRREREKRRRLSETEEEREQRLALRRERDKRRRLSETRLLTSVNRDYKKEEQLTEEDGPSKIIQRESMPD